VLRNEMDEGQGSEEKCSTRAQEGAPRTLLATDSRTDRSDQGTGAAAPQRGRGSDMAKMRWVLALIALAVVAFFLGFGITCFAKIVF